MLKNIIFTLLSLVALATSSVLQAAEQASAEAVPVQPLPANPPVTASATETVSEAAKKTQSVSDNHVDYRYCLELKTDREIAECRYKK